MSSNPISNVIDRARGVDAKMKDMEKDTFDVHHPANKSTTDYGAKVADQDNWLVATSESKHGPSMLEDHIAREKINRFDHERIPERVVHARGNGAFGHFTLFESAEDVTYAPILTDTSRKTPLFVRFSTVLGSRGSADTVRDVRGFAIKMYTDEGNWDIVGNNIPVFFVNDAIKFLDVIHAGKPEPHNEVPQAQTAHDNFWDFQYLHPETTAMHHWATSDRTIPRSYRMIQGFGVNTFRLINKEGVSHFVKFHWTPELGVNSLCWDEALKLAGQDPDFLRKDLWEAIDNGCYPKWKFGIQVLKEEDADKFDFDILDATKLWPEEEVPIRYIGQIELNRNTDEYFTQTEQIAFCTSHIVPGIDFSDDPLLQGRNFSYLDTQLSRLGVNFQQLPINRPVCPVMNFNRDGALQHTINKGTVNYWPNRFSAIPPHSVEEGGFQSYPEKIAGIKARLKNPKFKEHFKQAQLFRNSLSPHEKAHQLNAFGFELDHCEDPVVYSRMSQRIADVDLELAQAVAEMVGGEVPKEGRANEGHKSAPLSQAYYAPKEPTIESRRVAIIIADGFDKADFDVIYAAVKAASALPYVIGPRRSPIKPASGEAVTPAHHLEGFRSTMVDAIYIPGGSHVDTLKTNGRAVHWVREAFCHCKAIGATGTGVDLINIALSHLANDKVTLASKDVAQVNNSYGVVTAGKIEAPKFTDVFKIAKEATDFTSQFFNGISQHRCWERELDGLSTQLAY